MTEKQKRASFIELAAEKLGLIPNLHKERELDLVRLTGEGELTNFPPIEQWDDWTEYEACLLYTSPSPRDQRGSRMPSSA